MYKTVLEAIGNTPLIRLNKVSDETGCEILGKAEFLNPGQSVKDRAALYIIRDAVASGALKPGGTVVEGTAGNTGIGVSMVANAMGFKSVIVIPETQSEEKKNWANQFDNVANRQAHIETTGPEIWQQTDGKVDGFICSVGSGGTLAGVGMALKAKNPAVRIGLADPFGSAMFKYYTSGEFGATGSSITEGIGQGRETANLVGAPIDVAYQISDTDALNHVFYLVEHEGLVLGGSSGINIEGAVRMARELGPGHTIVTVLCDYGNRYQSKLFNPEFLRSKDLPVPGWLEKQTTLEIPYEDVPA